MPVLRSLTLVDAEPFDLGLLKGHPSLQQVFVDSRPAWHPGHLPNVQIGVPAAHARADSFCSRGEGTPLRMLCPDPAQGVDPGDIWDLREFDGDLTTEQLDASGTLVMDLTPLSGMHQLRALDLSHTSIEDLGPLRDLALLEELDISHTRIKTLFPLRTLPNLRILRASFTSIEALEGLPPESLEVLEIDGTRVHDLTPLRNARRLSTLHARDTRVVDLTPLNTSAQLRRLDVAGSAVSEISPLGQLGNLQSLAISGTAVKRLSALLQLTQLSRLDVAGVDAPFPGGLTLSRLAFVDARGRSEEQVEMLRLAVAPKPVMTIAPQGGRGAREGDGSVTVLLGDPESSASDVGPW